MIRHGKIVLAVGLVSGAFGCTSVQNGGSTLDQIQTALAPMQPYVEAYIEFGGPQDRWAGPGPFLMHVTAKDAPDVEIATVPEMFSLPVKTEPAKDQKKDHEPVLQTRKLASVTESGSAEAAPPATAPVAVPATNAPHSNRITREAARDHLARLAASMQDASSDPQFSGCLNPVRVRVIRADGAIVERQGCRASKGWPRLASETVDHFLGSLTNGTVAANSAPVHQPELVGSERQPASENPGKNH